tara:strand:+ start:336 stop:566 length:231 start_codon:yes stop_codon:yes gene_type:complete
MSDEEKNFKKMAFKLIKKSEDTLQEKIIKLLDLQLQILEDEVNTLKYKLAHNQLSEVELQLIHDSLVGVMEPEVEE